MKSEGVGQVKSEELPECCHRPEFDDWPAFIQHRVDEHGSCPGCGEEAAPGCSWGMCATGYPL